MNSKIDQFFDFLSKVLGFESSIFDVSTKLVDDIHLDSIQWMELLVWLRLNGADVDQLKPGSPAAISDIFDLLESSSGEPASLTAPTAVREIKDAFPGPTLLHSERFVLRPVLPDAIPFLYRLAVSEEVGFRWRFRGAVPNVETFQSTLWQGILVQFVVVDAIDQEPVGFVVAYNADHFRGIAYVAAVFVPNLVSTGLPVEAFEIFVRYIFRVWNFRKLYMEVPAYNYALIASGAGRRFDIEGCLKEFTYHDGRYWDEYLLAIGRHHLGIPPVDDRVA